MDRNEKARQEFEQGRQSRARKDAIERLTGDMQLGRAGVMDRFGNIIHAGDHVLIKLPNDPVMEVLSVTPNLDPSAPVGLLKVVVRCEVPIMCAVNQPAKSLVRIGKADTIAFTAVDDRSAAVAAGLIQTGGRAALRVPDRPGLIVLRTLAQIANAAADTVADEITDAQGVDEAMLFGANHPEGPLAWVARFGAAPLARVLDNIAAATGDPIYAPSDGLRFQLAD